MEADYERYVAFCKRVNRAPCSFEEFKVIRGGNMRGGK